MNEYPVTIMKLKKAVANPVLDRRRRGIYKLEVFPAGMHFKVTDRRKDVLEFYKDVKIEELPPRGVICTLNDVHIADFDLNISSLSQGELEKSNQFFKTLEPITEQEENLKAVLSTDRTMDALDLLVILVENKKVSLQDLKDAQEFFDTTDVPVLKQIFSRQGYPWA